MAATFTPNQTARGSLRAHYWEPNGVIYVPGDPGDTFEQGDVVTFTVGEGLADLITTNEDPFGVVAPGPLIVCPAFSTAFSYFGQGGDADPGKILTSEMKTYVPIIPWMTAGTQVRYAAFEDYLTDDVASYTVGASSVYAGLTTGVTADDYPNGAVVYVYSGTGAGQWNVVEDYDDAGGAADKMLVFHRKFATALDATSDLLILAGEGATNKGVGFMGRTGFEDRNNVEVDDHADNGKRTVLFDARTIKRDLAAGMLPLVPCTAFGLLA